MLIGLAVGLLFWFRRVDAARIEEFQALAARRGWALNVKEQRLGRPAVMRLSPRAGGTWLLETRLHGSNSVGSGELQYTEFNITTPFWLEGTMVIGPQIPDDTAALSNFIADKMDGPMGERLLGQIIGEHSAADAAGLSLHDGPDTLTILANTRPGLRFDLVAVARCMASWNQQSDDIKDHPIVIVNRDGLNVRLRQAIGRADKMEEFIDMSLELARIM